MCTHVTRVCNRLTAGECRFHWTMARTVYVIIVHVMMFLSWIHESASERKTRDLFCCQRDACRLLNELRTWWTADHCSNIGGLPNVNNYVLAVPKQFDGSTSVPLTAVPTPTRFAMQDCNIGVLLTICLSCARSMCIGMTDRRLLQYTLSCNVPAYVCAVTLTLSSSAALRIDWVAYDDDRVPESIRAA